jgi:hypothetical protein
MTGTATKQKLLSLYDAARHPEVKKLGLSRNHLRDAIERGALKRNNADIVKGRHGDRRIYAVTEAALLEFLEAAPEVVHPWSSPPVNKGHPPPLVRAAQKTQTTAVQKRTRLMRLYQELIKESREFDMTLEQYLDLIDFDQEKRKELADVLRTPYPSPHNMEDDDDRQREATGFGEENTAESLLCSEESGGDDDDALSLGDFRGLAD